MRQQLEVPMIIWRGAMQAEWNTLRQDGRMRLVWGISCVISLALSWWSALSLYENLQQWQVQGLVTLSLHLWLLFIVIWMSMGFLTMIATVEILRKGETLLLQTLPLFPAERFRALYGLLFVSSLWFWLLFQSVVTISVFLWVLGWSALPWLALLYIGIFFSVAMFLLGILAVLWLLMTFRWGWFYLGGLVMGISLAGAVLFYLLQGSVFDLSSPQWAVLIFLVLFGALCGPGASQAGRLYNAVVLLAQRRTHGQRKWSLPGLNLLIHILRSQGGLFRALLIRALLNQSRNWFFWMRIVSAWVMFALFPVVQSIALSYGMEAIAIPGLYIGVLGLFQVLETGPGAISSEGHRLALFLVAPFTSRQILWSRWLLYVLPVMLEAIAMMTIFCLFNWIPWHFWLPAFSVSFIVVSTGVSLLVWGSVWDSDMDRSAQDAMELIMLEEGPFTARRMILFCLSLCYLLGTICVLWYWSWLVAWGLLTLIGVAVIYLMYQFARYWLPRLLY